MEAYVHGVSTRKVDDLVHALGAPSGMSKSEVSRICTELDRDLASFRTRPLGHVGFPYLYRSSCYCLPWLSVLLMLFQYIIKCTAQAAGKTVTFMPKPLFGDNGNGMHCHQSIWKDGSPLFYNEVGYAGLSDLGRYYIGGLLKHAPSLLAFTNPTANSYHRLVPGFEAPVNLVYSQRNRSACARIPITGTNPKAKRVEFRVPDPSCNPYLAFAAMLMAGLDGIKNKIEPPEPVDKDLYELPPDEAAAIPQVPGSLEAVLANLETDHAYLTEGGVFTDDLIETWLDYKRTVELDQLRLRPHPHEFELYYETADRQTGP